MKPWTVYSGVQDCN